ncbi:MAG: serine O-acetyltransferase [Myxococcaceae bacterium]
MRWLDDLRADYQRYPGSGLSRLKLALQCQGVWAVATFRVGQGVYALPAPLKLIALLLYLPFAKFVECLSGIQLPPGTTVGPGLYIGHFGGIIVSSHAILGARCNLSQGVTIGASTRHGKRGAPRLGDRVYVAAGAKVFGPIAVGADVAIGANAVVNSDVPAGVTVAGIPAQVVSRRGSAGLIELEAGAPAELAIAAAENA